MRSFRKSFSQLAKVAQKKIDTAVSTYLASIHGTLKIILSENVALESERDPAFRRRVDEVVKESKAKIERIKTEIDH